MSNAKNNSVVYGRILKEPQFVYKKTGEEFCCRMIMAVDRSYKNKQGVFESDYIPVRLYGTERMEFAHMFHSGDNVIVSGQLKSEKFQGKTQTQYSIYLEVDQISWTYGRSVKKVPSIEAQNEKEDYECDLEISLELPI